MPDLILTKLSDIEILGLTLIGEARGEPIEGQIATGCVVRNRLHHNPTKYRDYADVCLEREQFSCWNANDPNYTVLIELVQKITNHQLVSDMYYRQCMWVSSGIINWQIADITNGARFYLTKSLYDSPQRPTWADKILTASTYGKQIFFNV